MSNETQKKTPFNFISYDGADETGHRAEVQVQVNRGKVKEIKENSAKEVADVHFTVPNLKYAIHGWIPTTEPAYELIKLAQEADEEVSFRIETQRKRNVDRKIPMAELKPDMATAKENVMVLLVGINGTLTSEHSTHPSEDPVHTGGRYVAGPAEKPVQGATNGQTNTVDLTSQVENFKKAATNPNIRASILDAMSANLVLNGANIEDIYEIMAGNDKRDDTKPENQAHFATEAPAWKQYNSDGRLNLGSSIVAAGVGIETMIHSQIENIAHIETSQPITNLDDAVEYYLNLTFAITDRIQEAVYGKGFRADRAASSHTRIRGLVYEIIKNTHLLPLTFNAQTNSVTYNKEAVDEWVKNVGREGIKRFNRSVKASVTIQGFNIPVPVSLNQQAETIQNSAPQPESIIEPKVETPVIEETPKQEETPEVTEPVKETATENVTPEPVGDEKPSYEAPITPTVTETPAEVAIDESNIYRVQLTSEEVDGEELATPETIASFKELFTNLGFDISDRAELSRITKLLAYTFGENYANVKNVPDFFVEEFIDHYQSFGAETLNQAVRLAVEGK